MKRFRLFMAALTLAGLASFVAAPLTASAAPVSWSGCAQFYRVAPGDQLGLIAIRFGTSVGALSNINGLFNANLIFTGQVLCVRGVVHQPTDVDGFFYRVRPGETLRIIGARYGWNFWFLARVNHIPNVNFIFAGEELFIPGH